MRTVSGCFLNIAYYKMMHSGKLWPVLAVVNESASVSGICNSYLRMQEQPHQEMKVMETSWDHWNSARYPWSILCTTGPPDVDTVVPRGYLTDNFSYRTLSFSQYTGTIFIASLVFSGMLHLCQLYHYTVEQFNFVLLH